MKDMRKGANLVTGVARDDKGEFKSSTSKKANYSRSRKQLTSLELAAIEAMTDPVARAKVRAMWF